MLTKTTISIEGMTCQHCINAVTRALKACSGVADVAVSLQGKSAVVTYDDKKATPGQFREAIEEEGYTVLGTPADEKPEN